MAEQVYGADLAGVEGQLAAERAHVDAPVVRAAEGDHVQVAVSGGEAQVGRAVGGLVVLGVLALGHARRAFAVDGPGQARVDRLAVDVQPGAHLAQQLRLGFRDRAVGARTDVQQQAAVLADDVHERGQQLMRALVVVVLDIAPGGARR